MHGLILNLSLPFWQVQPGNMLFSKELVTSIILHPNCYLHEFPYYNYLSHKISSAEYYCSQLGVASIYMVISIGSVLCAAWCLRRLVLPSTSSSAKMIYTFKLSVPLLIAQPQPDRSPLLASAMPVVPYMLRPSSAWFLSCAFQPPVDPSCLSDWAFCCCLLEPMHPSIRLQDPRFPLEASLQKISFESLHVPSHS